MPNTNGFGGGFGSFVNYDPASDQKSPDEMRKYLSTVNPDKFPLRYYMAVTPEDIPRLALADTLTEYAVRYELPNNYCPLILSGHPLIMALLLRDDDITEKLLSTNMDEFWSEPICAIFYNHIGWNPTTDNNPISIETMLYAPAYPIRKDLRDRIITGIETHIQNINGFNMKYAFDYACIRGIAQPVVQKRLLADSRRHPALFENICFDNVMDFSTMAFLAKTRKNDECALSRLMDGITKGRVTKLSTGAFMDLSVFNGMKAFSEYYKASPALKKRFFRFLICIFSRSLRIEEEFPFSQGMPTFVEEESSHFLELMCDFLPSEIDFQDILDSDYAISLDKPTVYKLGRVLYKRPFDLLLNDDLPADHPVDTNILFGTGELFDNNHYIQCNMDCMNWFDYIGNIRRIRTRSGRPLDNKNVLKMLKQHSYLFRDIILSLLEKGLLDGTDLDYIIKRIVKTEDCRYMVPMLMLLKEGELRKYDN